MKGGGLLLKVTFVVQTSLISLALNSATSYKVRAPYALFSSQLSIFCIKKIDKYFKLKIILMFLSPLILKMKLKYYVVLMIETEDIA